MVLPFILPLLVSFRLQIAYGKVKNFQIGVNKLVGNLKVSINYCIPRSLLRHAKFITSHSQAIV